MEVTKRRSATVKFVVPTNLATANYRLFKDGEIYGTPRSVTPSGGVASVDIPYSLSSEEGQVEVVLSFTYNDGFATNSYEKSQWVDFINPILDDSEILEIHPNATAAEIERIEKATRHIINAHTGQTFSLFHGTHTVRGDNGKMLMLPQRLLQVETVNSNEAVGFYDIGADGWVLFHYPWGIPPLKADYHGLHYTTNGVIRNPDNVSLGTWSSTQPYEITGTWGWVEVPPQVKEAAKLLVNDYACADQAYRDRYLTSMTAADWRIQYHSGAFRDTGNVRADQLLSDYVLKRGWAVI